MRFSLLPLAAAALISGSGLHAELRVGHPDVPSLEGRARPLAADTEAVDAPMEPAEALALGTLPLPAEREATTRASRVEVALGSLAPGVRQQSHPQALRMAIGAYYNYRASHPERVQNPYLYFVDYGLDSRTPRGYVFDMDALRVVDGPFAVAHGRGSAAGRDGIPTRFSNQPGSEATSLGLFLTQELYDFSGTSDGRPYRSIGLRLLGLSGAFNSAARGRGVVVHGAPYVTDETAGRSEGCPAMEPSRASWLLPKIGRGGLVFLFSPYDASLLRDEPWSHALPGRVAGLLSVPDVAPAVLGSQAR